MDVKIDPANMPDMLKDYYVGVSFTTKLSHK
jgi:hypothetical protein